MATPMLSMLCVCALVSSLLQLGSGVCMLAFVFCKTYCLCRIQLCVCVCVVCLAYHILFLAFALPCLYPGTLWRGAAARPGPAAPTVCPTPVSAAYAAADLTCEGGRAAYRGTWGSRCIPVRCPPVWCMPVCCLPIR